MSAALSVTLELAVALRITELKKLGYIPSRAKEETQKMANAIARHGDELLYTNAKIFNSLALAIAVLAFQPGGIKVFGFTFEANFEDSSQSTEEY